VLPNVIAIEAELNPDMLRVNVPVVVVVFLVTLSVFGLTEPWNGLLSEMVDAALALSTVGFPNWSTKETLAVRESLNPPPDHVHE
jgi:hypothetical protein